MTGRGEHGRPAGVPPAAVALVALLAGCGGPSAPVTIGPGPADAGRACVLEAGQRLGGRSRDGRQPPERHRLRPPRHLRHGDRWLGRGHPEGQLRHLTVRVSGGTTWRGSWTGAQARSVVALAPRRTTVDRAELARVSGPAAAPIVIAADFDC